MTYKDGHEVCNTHGCERPVTHACLVDWSPWNPNGMVTRHCEADARAAAQANIDIGIATRVYFASLEELEVAA